MSYSLKNTPHFSYCCLEKYFQNFKCGANLEPTHFCPLFKDRHYLSQQKFVVKLGQSGPKLWACPNLWILTMGVLQLLGVPDSTGYLFILLFFF